MNDTDELRLAVLSAIITQHGPIPCISVKMIQGISGRHDSIKYRLVETHVTHRPEDGAVILAYSPFAGLPEPTEFSGRLLANRRRDLLCELLRRLPVFPLMFDTALLPNAVIAILRCLQVSPDGVKILPLVAEKRLPRDSINNPQVSPNQGTM